MIAMLHKGIETRLIDVKLTQYPRAPGTVRGGAVLLGVIAIIGETPATTTTLTYQSLWDISPRHPSVIRNVADVVGEIPIDDSTV